MNILLIFQDICFHGNLSSSLDVNIDDNYFSLIGGWYSLQILFKIKSEHDENDAQNLLRANTSENENQNYRKQIFSNVLYWIEIYWINITDPSFIEIFDYKNR